MEDNVVGAFLTTDPQYNSEKATAYQEPKLWRFVDHEETIDEVHLLNSGKHGVVILAAMRRHVYAMKVVRSPDTSHRAVLTDLAV